MIRKWSDWSKNTWGRARFTQKQDADWLKHWANWQRRAPWRAINELDSYETQHPGG